MKLYLVVSEELEARTGPPGVYCIAELVLADKPSQAKWSAWSTDKDTFNRHDITEMPKMSCRCVGDFPHETQRRIVSNDSAFVQGWEAQ